MATGAVWYIFQQHIKLLDLENPLFGAGFVAVSLVLAEFYCFSQFSV